MLGGLCLISHSKEMFKNKSIVFLIIFLVLLIASLNFLAFSFYWYWRIWWFDLLMHFLGGMFVASLGYYFYYLLVSRERLSLFRLLILLIFSSLVIGGLWEIFEFSIDAYWSAHVNIKSLQILQAGSLDTLSDLLFDFLGAIAFGLFIHYIPLLPDNNLEKQKENHDN